MATEKTLQLNDLLKSLQEVTSPSYNDSVALIDASGNFKRQSLVAIPRFVDLTRAEQPGTVMEVKDFALKYVKDLPVGSVLSDGSHSNVIKWHVKAGDYSFCTQDVVFHVAKNNVPLTAIWARCCLKIQHIMNNATWVVNMTTGSSSADYYESVSQISGGVKTAVNQIVTSYLPLLSTVRRKGGRHERQGDGADQRSAERHNDGCNGRTSNFHGLGRDERPRYIQGRRSRFNRDNTDKRSQMVLRSCNCNEKQTRNHPNLIFKLIGCCDKRVQEPRLDLVRLSDTSICIANGKEVAA